MHPAVFLDLDNTIIHDAAGSADPASLSLIQGAAPAIASLRGLGYRVVVVANHEAVARGKMTEDDVHDLHARVAELVSKTANGAVIDAFYYCPFHPKGNLKQYKKDHKNRKPKPGMLQQAAEEMQLDLSSSWMIGDELADVQAGRSAGTRTVLLRADADRLQPIDLAQTPGVVSEASEADRPAGPDFFAVGLVDAARLIAQQPRVEAEQQKRAKEGSGRKWDAEKIAKLQVARPRREPVNKPEPAAAGARAFRPWGAPVPEEESDGKPIVAKPFRKRTQPEPDPAPVKQPPAPAQTQPVPAPSEPQAIPDNIRQAIDLKKQARARGETPETGVDKTLKLILQELRSQRNGAQEFSFVTIIAVALQLVAIICLLGGLFMGGADDGLFFRWLAVALMAQLIAIATLLYGR
ncbi:MAG: HAD-IIIA family hydrolase [Phycisphaeraceae bacterium]